MKNIKTLTIGISAHNEEKNISSLLESIFAQKQRNYVLENIYVVCDGCTDNTESVVRNYIPYQAPIDMEFENP
jgi:glycosyltransferase involved in cell wall biosynthesis